MIIRLKPFCPYSKPQNLTRIKINKTTPKTMILSKSPKILLSAGTNIQIAHEQKAAINIWIIRSIKSKFPGFIRRPGPGPGTALEANL
jgi:hypothetical protein